CLKFANRFLLPNPFLSGLRNPVPDPTRLLALGGSG
ncbi:MAG: hypothetical protein RLZZ582_1204, partial [Verrucomicrobiota bacterium]